MVWDWWCIWNVYAREIQLGLFRKQGKGGRSTPHISHDIFHHSHFDFDFGLDHMHLYLNDSRRWNCIWMAMVLFGLWCLNDCNVFLFYIWIWIWLFELNPHASTPIFDIWLVAIYRHQNLVCICATQFIKLQPWIESKGWSKDTLSRTPLILQQKLQKP